ncbi:hypothetical protein ACFLS8_03945 [Chloroflexota bacterium]
MTNLENGVGSKSRRNEQGARSEVECQGVNAFYDANRFKGKADVFDDGEAVGPSSPSFLVRNSINVNAQLHNARGLLTMWYFMDYKVRVGMTNIILNRKDDPSVMKIIQSKWKSRYFNEGRRSISSKIKRRIGKYYHVPGLMETLTYDPKKISKMDAWANYGKDVRRFINAVNQYRYRRGWRRTHYLWVVEVQKETGYPHVHIFFPKLKWLAPLNIINGNWTKGRANIGAPKRINVNCAGYICKYLRKMEGWDDLHLAMLWSGHCRMYSFSRGFFASLDKKTPEWNRWAILQTDDLALLEKCLEDGGYTIERSRGSPFSCN